MLRQDDYLIRSIVEEGLVAAERCDEAVRMAAEKDLTIDDALVTLGVLSAKQIGVLRAGLCECPYVDLDHYEIDIQNAAILPRNTAEKHLAFPLFIVNGVATLGMVDPLNVRAIDQVRQFVRAEIEPVLCSPDALKRLIARAYSLVSHNESAETAKAAVSSDLTTGEEPIVAAVNQIINDAVSDRASDIHISPCERELQLRFRIDGELQRRQGPPLTAHSGMVQRLKVMAHLDLTQTRRPQDGKFRFTARTEQVEIRLSTMPTVAGENIVMRLIRPNTQIGDFTDLGMSQTLSDEMHELIEHPHGMILVSGPTGSGKTSTLYTAVKHLNTPDRNVMTIEDPVEVRMEGVRQIQSNSEIGLTFAAALRSILRQDPDVVLVGEIRDNETAMIAAQASLTGHLVLSTLHTNDAAGAIARLKDLGVPSFVINASLLGVVGQRLVRRVCDHCAQPQAPDAALLRRFGVAADSGAFRMGEGCGHCSNAGFRGRVGVYELLAMNETIANAIERNASTNELQRLCAQQGMRPMWLDGLDKARIGVTTLEEVARAVMTGDIEAGEPTMRAAA